MYLRKNQGQWDNTYFVSLNDNLLDILLKMKRIDLFFACFVLIGSFLLLGGSVIFSSQADAAMSTSIGFFLGGGISCLIGLAGLLFCKKE